MTNPSEHDINAEYNRLIQKPIHEVAAMIPHYRIRRACGCECGGCWWLICYSTGYPDATMVAAGEVLAHRLGIEADLYRWQRLELHA